MQYGEIILDDQMAAEAHVEMQAGEDAIERIHIIELDVIKWRDKLPGSDRDEKAQACEDFWNNFAEHTIILQEVGLKRKIAVEPSTPHKNLLEKAIKGVKRDIQDAVEDSLLKKSYSKSYLMSLIQYIDRGKLETRYR